jgi:hypothetical protein
MKLNGSEMKFSVLECGNSCWHLEEGGAEAGKSLLLLFSITCIHSSSERWGERRQVFNERKNSNFKIEREIVLCGI